MARILHISDLHIGARLGRYSQNEDIKKCLEFISDYTLNEKIDALLIAGDIFDGFNPSGESEDIYYSFLSKISAAGAKTFIIAGNHDNHERLCAPERLFSAHHIFVAGYDARSEYEPLETVIGEEPASIIAIPYIPDAALISSSPGAEADEAALNYSAAYAKLIHRAALKCRSELKISLGHLFVKNSLPAGSERAIQQGNAYLVEFAEFPKNIAYYAFGHLHRPQRVADNAYYSGSIIPVSIDEAASDKKMMLIETSKNLISGISEIKLPRSSNYHNYKGAFEHVMRSIEGTSDAYVSIIFSEVINLEKQDILQKTVREKNIKIVSINFEISRTAESFNLNSTDFKNLSLEELFKLFIKDSECDKDKVLKQFNRVVQSVMAGENII
ncbi:MAG TPA: exonuclease subunit SbcD [Candidatus Wallbacteria bacterium]|nr:exonuclease subunit SbcD [Candidatus Wallbacteria bacterium]